MPPTLTSLAQHLDRKMAAHFARIEQSPAFRAIEDPATPLPLAMAIVKHTLLEVFSYGPHVTEATFTAIGRLPKNRPDLMRPMILHDLSEVDHGEMALRDFVRLGGDEPWARSRRITPASFAMAAVARMLGERDNPFSYLGYMYLFESLTPPVTERAQKALYAKGFPVQAREFVDTHAAEDVGHTRLLADLIDRVSHEFPDAAEAIEYGFDCFTAVYPLPIWDAAYARARAEFS